MTFADLNIPGVAGPVTTEYSFWAGYKFFVNGERIKPQGFPRNRLELPGESAPVEAKIKGGLFRAHPSLVVGETEYPTGPPTPRFLQVLAVLPIIGLVLIQGALGFLLAFGGIALNMGVVRGERPDAIKATLLALTFIVILAIEIAVFVAIASN